MVNIPDYFERAVALLASQFQLTNPGGAYTNFQKMLYAILTQAQQLNTQEQLLQTMRSIDTAQGVQLDGLGQILGLPRVPGQSDDSYREALQFQIFVNMANGTPQDVIQVLEFLTKASRVWYYEIYPAAYGLTTNGEIFPPNPSDLYTAFQSVSPAAVNLVAIVATYNTNPFVFSSDPFDEQFYVNPSEIDPLQRNPFEVNPGAGLVDLYIQRGETSNPDFGGGFAEALGAYPNYTTDITGAGQFSEAIQE